MVKIICRKENFTFWTSLEEDLWIPTSNLWVSRLLLQILKHELQNQLLKIFLCFGVTLAATGIFWDFFGVYSVCSRVPEPTRIYNQQDLISAVGLICLIKWTDWMKPRQLSVSKRSRAQPHSRATCRVLIGWSWSARIAACARGRACATQSRSFVHVFAVGPTNGWHNARWRDRHAARSGSSQRLFLVI